MIRLASIHSFYKDNTGFVYAASFTMAQIAIFKT